MSGLYDSTVADHAPRVPNTVSTVVEALLVLVMYDWPSGTTLTRTGAATEAR